ncbi:MAG: oligoendopeptidase F [Anaeromyxobacter sp.]
MRSLSLALLTLLAAAPAAATAAAKDRSEIPDKYKWNLTELYKTDADWAAGRDALAKRIPELGKYQGTLAKSPAAMFEALDAIWKAQLDLERLYVYASSRSDEDTRASAPLEQKQAAEQLWVDLSAATSWLQPEVIAMDPAQVKGFLDQEKRLEPWRFFLDDTLRLKPHTRSAPEEELIAQASDLGGAGSNAYGLLANADLPWPTVKLSTGEEVRLDQSGYGLHRQDRNLDDRTLVFANFFGALKGYERTMGANLYSAVKAQSFTRKARHYDSNLEASLFPNAIPTTVYTQLVSDVRRSLPTLHRYLALRQRILKLDKLRYQDLYVPLVDKVDMKFDPDQARQIVLQAVAPLGKKYTGMLSKGFESGWTDYLPSTGKRSGAYSTGVYGVHPYQLLNFNGRYDDVSTFAHESGHSIHTALAFEAQPYPTSGYALFVAEVASTLNENLLLHHMLGKAKDDATRLSLLGAWLDGARTTLFRQAQFADFELQMHQKAEKGETLTGENLSQMYLETVRTYYGHDKGVCQVDDLLGIEWAFIPHFYRPFYVYQYATSFVASTALARGIREEAAKGKGTAKRDAYLGMLAAGGSKYPIDLLKGAGVDMTTSKPFDATIAEMNSTMDEMEKILARMEKADAKAKKK